LGERRALRWRETDSKFQFLVARPSKSSWEADCSRAERICRGTEGSNPSPSSGESANFRFLRRFGHPEQTLGIVTLLGGVYRIAERAGRSFASEWALTSEQIPAATIMKHGVVNRVVPDSELEQSARQLALRAAGGATRAYAAHKALLRIWAEAGVAAADTAMFDIAMPLFETEDVRCGIPSAVDALKAGRPRPAPVRPVARPGSKSAE
jgi:hypothetical protein